MSATTEVRVASASPEETQRIAAAVASCVRGGDVLLLSGDLGAGKTTFTQGFGRALGITEPITSPTFTLMRDYREGRLRLLHVDVYRLETLQEVVDLGIGELVEEAAVALVEWGEAAAPALPADHLLVTIEHDPDDDEVRTITFRAAGPTWLGRMDRLAQAVDP